MPSPAAPCMCPGDSGCTPVPVGSGVSASLSPARRPEDNRGESLRDSEPSVEMSARCELTHEDERALPRGEPIPPPAFSRVPGP